MESIRHLPHHTPAEDISDGLVSLGLEVVSVKYETATRRSPPEGTKIINLAQFLVILPRTAKSQNIFGSDAAYNSNNNNLSTPSSSGKPTLAKKQSVPAP
jgi:hypothetical protein